MFNQETVNLSTQGQALKIHAISTGAISVKRKFREATKTGILAQAEFILDEDFTEWLPVWVWVVEHPEGVFIVDTGENSRVNDKNYFVPTGPLGNWLNKRLSKFKVERSDDIDMQLAELNIPVDKVKAVILTHLHLDHTDGLKFFPSTDILVNKLEWEKPVGVFPKLYPVWFKPSLIDLSTTFDVFDKAKFITKSQDLILIHTPGHTHGHSAVLLKAENCFIFFAGDICYRQAQIADDKYSGFNVSHVKAKQTYDCIRRFAEKHRVVFLPSHDVEAAARLRNLIPL